MKWPTAFLATLFLRVLCVAKAEYGLLCEGGYSGQANNENCYRIYESPPYNYNDARKYCQEENGDLASIHNAFEDNFIKSFKKEGVLIGLQYSESTKSFSWSDGTTFDYTNLDPSFEENMDFLGYCAQYRGGKWTNADCNADLLKYACKRPAVNYTITPSNVCPNSSTFYVGGGVLLSPGFPNKYAAGLSCKYNLAAKNGYVIKILLDNVDTPYGYDWIAVMNGHDTTTEHNVNFYHQDTAGYEVTIKTNRIELILHGTSGGSFKLTWIESKEAIDTFLLALDPSQMISNANEYFHCTPGYTLFEKNCYRLISSNKLSYFEAVAYCRDEGGDVASIHGSPADSFLQTMVASVGEALIGLLYIGSNTYQWSDGTAVDYTNYAEEFVALHDYLGNCARTKGGQWHNAECTDPMSFICEKKALNISTTANNICPSADTVYKISGVIFSPGYPETFAAGLPSCRYELMAKTNYYIKVIVDEIEMASNDYFYVYYSYNAQWFYSSVDALFGGSPGSRGTVIIYPHNHIALVLTRNSKQAGKYRISWTQIPSS